MAKQTKERMWSDWVAIRNIVGFQELLKSETEDHKYKILATLLAAESAKPKEPQAEAPRSTKIDPDSVTVDVGNPLIGFLLGVLLIVGTMAILFGWEIYSGDADASMAFVTAHGR